MFEITNLRQGAILNHHHGIEDEKGLTVKVEGISDLASHVAIAGNVCGGGLDVSDPANRDMSLHGNTVGGGK